MNSRLNFSRLVSLFILTVFVGIGITSMAAQKGGKEVGLQLYSVREAIKKTDIKTVVQQVGAMGYKIVEAAGYADGKFYGMEPAAFKALCEANGLNFYSSHCGQAVPDKAGWDACMKWWDTCIAAHKAAGVKYIVQPFMDKVGYSSLEGLKRYCDYFNAVGAKCNAAGIRFGYHNHSGEFKAIDGQTIYDYMLKNTDPKKVMFQMDLYWITEGGKNPVDYFKAYPGRFELWHVKDKRELGGSDAVMNFKPIFENAKLAGMKKYVVEVEEFNSNPIDGVKQSLEFLQKADYVK